MACNISSFSRVLSLSAILLTGSAHADFTTNLVAYYNMNGQTQNQFGGSDKDATATSGITYAAGQSGFGQTAVFASSADQRIDLPYVDALKFATNNFTVSMWVNMSELQLSDTPVATNKNWDSGGNQGWVLTAARDTGQDPFANFTGGTDRNRRDVNSNVNLSLGSWHSLVYTVDRAATMSIYIDGTFRNSVDISGSVGSLDTGFAISLGGNSGGPTGPRTYENNHNYRGLMDDVAFWSRTLTATEVDTLNASGVAGQSLGALLTPVPEPAAFVQLGLGIASIIGLVVARRRRLA